MRIRRDLYLKRLVERERNGLIKVVTGIRRCGKSFLLNELFTEHLRARGVGEDHIVRLSLEGIANVKYRDPETAYAYITGQLRDSNTHYVIIDEVQMMRDFTEVLNGLLLLGNADVYVTGSNSKFLSADIATEFRGRGDVVQVHPLRFAEFVTAYDDVYDAWDDYVVCGGMPLVLSYASREGKQEYLRGLFATAYTRDIVERYKLRGEKNLEELLDVIASSVGAFVSPAKLERSFNSVKNENLTRDTIARYTDCLEEAFIVSKARRFDLKGRRYIGTPFKLYFEDVGLRNARLNFRQTEENHIMENIIYNDLRARGCAVDVGSVEYYGKDASGKTVRTTGEVDFVVNLGSRRCYIQSAWEIPSAEKLEQEKRSLVKAGDSFKKMIVVRGAMKPNIDEDGVVRVGAINFLLDDGILW